MLIFVPWEFSFGDRKASGYLKYGCEFWDSLIPEMQRRVVAEDVRKIIADLTAIEVGNPIRCKEWSCNAS